MARDFRVVDRDSPMLLPPDLRDWLPEDHLAWLVLDVVGQCDLSAIEATFRRGGVGREAYDPGMLTALLVYAYCHGIRSSRAIEKACLTDVGFRVIAAQQRPDHSTISRFRGKHATALAGLFGQVLAVCHRHGLGQVGIVAIDGTKIAGQASPRKNYTEERLRELAADIVAEAGEVDAAEDAEYGADNRGDELPETLAPGPDRAARIRRALESLEEESAERVAEDVAAASRNLARAQKTEGRERRRVEDRHAVDRGAYGNRRRPFGEQQRWKQARERVATAEQDLEAARAGQGRRATGRRTKAGPVKPSRRNITDPDTRLMATRGHGFIQGFNAQIAVSDDHLILATEVTNDGTDHAWLLPMQSLAVDNVTEHMPGEEIQTVLADAGYCTLEALTAEGGPDRLIATGRDPAEPSRGGTSQAIAAMAQRLEPDSPDRKIYQRRQATVEPVIGHLKDRTGLRRFARRGLQAARDELALAAIAHNIRRLALV